MSKVALSLGTAPARNAIPSLGLNREVIGCAPVNASWLLERSVGSTMSRKLLHLLARKPHQCANRSSLVGSYDTNSSKPARLLFAGTSFVDANDDSFFNAADGDVLLNNGELDDGVFDTAVAEGPNYTVPIPGAGLVIRRCAACRKQHSPRRRW